MNVRLRAPTPPSPGGSRKTTAGRPRTGLLLWPALWLAVVAALPVTAADSVVTTNDKTLLGTVFVLAPDPVILQQDGTAAWLELPRREIRSVKLDLGPDGRWARVVTQDGATAFKAFSQQDGKVAGKDAEGKESSFTAGELRELAFYPVARAARQLPVPFVKQKPDYCGEACIEMVTAFLGEPVTQDRFNELAHLGGRRGVYGSELVAVVDRTLKLRTTGRGFRACKTALDAVVDRVQLLRALDAQRPVLLGVWSDSTKKHNEDQWAFDHFVLLVGYDLHKGVFLIHDPGRGAQQEWSFADFTKHRVNKFGGLFQLEFLPIRSWTVSGKKVRAELLSAGKDEVTLRPEAGEPLKVALKELGEEDRRLVEGLQR